MQVTIIVTIPGKLATNPVQDGNLTSSRQIRTWLSSKKHFFLQVMEVKSEANLSTVVNQRVMVPGY